MHSRSYVPVKTLNGIVRVLPLGKTINPDGYNNDKQMNKLYNKITYLLVI